MATIEAFFWQNKKKNSFLLSVLSQEEASIFPDEVICQDHCQTLQITRNQVLYPIIY